MARHQNTQPAAVEGLDRPDEPAIAVEELSKTYPVRFGTSVTALDDVSFDIPRGSVVGLLGPNGAGKTTLIKCILDLIVPTEGEVRVDGLPTAERGPRSYRKVSAMLEGARNVYWRLTVRENLDYFTGLQGVNPRSVADENRALIESLDLGDKADEPVNKLSRGMKQKVALACTLARRTPIVFLDEPTIGLDVEASLNLLDRLNSLIDEEQRTVVLSSHDMDTVQQLCDRVVILSEGSVVADDTVEGLLDLFRRRAYRLTFDGELSTGVRQSVEAEFGGVEWTLQRGDHEVEVTLDDPDRVYDLVGLLGDAGVTIDSMETVEPDFADVFLNVVKSDEEPAAPRAGGTR